MKNIILITSSFPYGCGEQFLETEVKYFCDNKNFKLTILPISSGNVTRRDISSCIKVDETLLSYELNTMATRIFYFIRSLKSKVFYKELFSENLFSFNKIKYFSLSISRYQMFYELFDMLLSKQDNLKETIFYTYWHTEATYALQHLKHKYHYQLISRIHGGDLYKERKPFGYMPLKKHFTENIDKVFTIANSANTYLVQTYQFNQTVLELSRLGVEDYGITASISNENSLKIVSCSFLVEVKQIHKIIESLVIVVEKLNHIKFTWIHIGNGLLHNELIKLAEKRLLNISNIEFNFLGTLSNKDVYEFYKNNKVDVFINTSESEGVPVAIMEAMSCHIPIIAPNVGGIHDMLINHFNGCLLSAECRIDEIVDALKNINFFKNRTIRNNSYKLYLEKYNAKINYVNFIETITKL